FCLAEPKSVDSLHLTIAAATSSMDQPHLTSRSVLFSLQILCSLIYSILFLFCSNGLSYSRLPNHVLSDCDAGPVHCGPCCATGLRFAVCQSIACKVERLKHHTIDI